MIKEEQKSLEEIRAEYGEQVNTIFADYERLLPKAMSRGLTTRVERTTSLCLLDEPLFETLVGEIQMEEVSVPIILLIFQEGDRITHVNTCVGVRGANKDNFYICNAVLARESGEWQVERSMVSLGSLPATQDIDASVYFHELTVRKLESLVEHVQ